MPGGTIPVAGVLFPAAERATSRRQSTARANAWRTRTSENGGRLVSNP